MLTNALTSAPLWLILALAGSLLLAGTVKGTIGVGMPVVAFLGAFSRYKVRNHLPFGGSTGVRFVPPVERNRKLM